MSGHHPRDHARQNPGKPAIIMADGRTRTYGELVAGADRLRCLLVGAGLGRGDGIGQLMENGPLSFDACWAALDGGYYFTPISTLLTPPEIAYILTDSGTRVLVTSTKLEAAARLAAALAPSVERVLVLDGADSDEVAALPADPPPADALEGGLLLFSSGTTGVPKAVRPRLSDLPPDRPPALSEKLIGLYAIDAQTVYLSPAPNYHTAPLKWIITVLIAGGTSIVMDKFDASLALELMARHRVTLSQWVPTMLVRLLRLPESERAVALPAHFVAVHAAAPCPPWVKRAIIDWWGPIVHEYYAGTESNGLTALDSFEWLAHPGSVGRSKRGTIHIMADDGETQCAMGETGLVFFEGGTPFEYLGDAEKTARSRNKRGWSTIGDMGYIDGEGYLYLTDRRDDVIISGGVNIYPQEIEGALLEHPGVADAAVFGVPCAEFGERVMAVVQLGSDLPGAEAAISAWVADRLAAYKRPRAWAFIDDMPRLPTGKLLRRLLRERFAEAGATSLSIEIDSEERIVP
jgi:long-chain acyl-CoA synthetase